MNKSLPFLLVVASLLTACGAPAKTVTGTGNVLSVQSYNQVVKKGELVDPKHGKETRFAYGAIVGVNATAANGVGYLHTFADGTTVATANLNILPAPKGKTYLVWTADDTGGSAKLRGELTSLVGDARHSLRYETTDAATALVNVIITLEPDTAAHDQPGAAVAAGTMKASK